jgi:hypothetical protein
MTQGQTEQPAITFDLLLQLFQSRFSDYFESLHSTDNLLMISEEFDLLGSPLVPKEMIAFAHRLRDSMGLSEDHWRLILAAGLGLLETISDTFERHERLGGRQLQPQDV